MDLIFAKKQFRHPFGEKFEDSAQVNYDVKIVLETALYL